MGPIGIIRVTDATTVNQPVYKCPEIWVTPQFVNAVKSFRFDVSHPVTDGLDAFIGDHLLYETAAAKAAWQIVGVHDERPMLIAKWPD
jgi:hypothetical protein